MNRLQQLAGLNEEIEVKQGINASKLQFILRDLADIYDQQIADDLTKDEFKKYTVGQIIDDWIKLKKGIKEAGVTSNPVVPQSPQDQTADVKRLATMMQSNKSLMTALKNVNNGREVDDFLTFVLNSINDRVTGVQKQHLKTLIDNRFNK